MTSTMLAILLTLTLLSLPVEGASAAVTMPDGGGGVTAEPVQRPAPVTRSAHVARPVPVSRPTTAVATPPERHFLDTVSYEPQHMNNCGPVTIDMILGHYGITLSQVYTANKLRPSLDDVSVDNIEMVSFAKIEYGYQGEVRWGGNMRLIEAFIANNIPVIVLQLLDPKSDIDHFRVVQGYDRARRVVTVSDSYRGENLQWSYEYFEGLWDRSPREYSIVYPPRKAALVQAITQQYRAEEKTLERESLAEMQSYINASPSDPWGWLRLGQMLHHWNHDQQALGAWNRAVELGLPQKALWYVVWPISLLNQIGRHQEARELASGVLAGQPASSEAYYERARANMALGNTSLARHDLRLALEYAPYNPQFRAAYARSQASDGDLGKVMRTRPSSEL